MLNGKVIMLKERPHKRRVPFLNTTATDDISFMLLVFFLVMTSIDTDKGLVRKLPPMENEKKENVTTIDKDNMLELTLTASGRIIADNEPVEDGKLKDIIVAFVNRSSNPKKHVIMININPEAEYNAYFNMQNDIVAAYNIVRNRHAIKTLGHSFAACSQKEKDEITSLYPQRIAETYLEEKKGGAQ